MYKNSDKYKSEKMEKTLRLIESRGHEFISGDYETKHCSLTVLCPTHGIICTNFDNYRRSKTGCKGCGKSAIGNAHRGKIVSLESRIKLSESIKKSRILKPRTPSEWRSTVEYKEWRKGVRSFWNHECAITGKRGTLDSHHLFTGSVWTEHAFDVKNGILLCRSAHWTFHKLFGSKKNTLEQFLEYIDMLISSQVSLECGKGSETRSYDPERIMKTQERLAQLKNELVMI
jgi:hypothetical protein